MSESVSGKVLRCGFCGKAEAEVSFLVQGVLDGVAICPNCVKLCDEVVSQCSGPEKKGVTDSNHLEIDPQEMVARLNEYVIGQEKAKKVISVAVSNHYKRQRMKDDDVEKTNIMLIGPTGCGKTYLVRQVAKVLEVPVAIVEATNITEAGYVGRSVDSIFESLLRASNWDIEKAEKGIVYIDEIDKIAAKNTSTRDINGEGVQQALLALLENGEIEIKRKVEMGEESYILNTSGILFICGGAFEGMLERKKGNEIGFGKGEAIEKKVEIREQLKKFGMIPEFVGRLPAIVQLNELTVDDLMKIMTETKNSTIDQYKKLLEHDDVHLEIDDLALRKIAELAISRKIGARGLRSVVDELVLDTMFNVSKLKNQHVKLDEAAVAALY